MQSQCHVSTCVLAQKMHVEGHNYSPHFNMHFCFDMFNMHYLNLHVEKICMLKKTMHVESLISCIQHAKKKEMISNIQFFLIAC